MSFFASASLVVPAPAELCYLRFADFGSWRAWMPRSFRPLRGPGHSLEVGDHLWVQIAGTPAPVRLVVVRMDQPREITWRGGVPGVLTGEHAFLFEDLRDGTTMIRSREIWSGALAELGVTERSIRPMAERIGAEQLTAFATYLQGPPSRR